MLNLQQLKQIVTTKLASKWQIDWHLFETIDSTQKFLLSKQDPANKSLQICISKEQTCGVGQKKNSWVSPLEAGLWFSISAQLPEAQIPWSLAIAKDIAMVIYTQGITPQLKWPNDILINHQKCAGKSEVHASLFMACAFP